VHVPVGGGGGPTSGARDFAPSHRRRTLMVSTCKAKNLPTCDDPSVTADYADRLSTATALRLNALANRCLRRPDCNLAATQLQAAHKCRPSASRSSYGIWHA
jgi:hypothetical protein